MQIQRNCGLTAPNTSHDIITLVLDTLCARGMKNFIILGYMAMKSHPAGAPSARLPTFEGDVPVARPGCFGRAHQHSKSDLL